MIYREQLRSQALDAVQIRIAKSGIPIDSTLQAMLASATGELANGKTFVQRFVSLKALHGALFFMSWFNIAGRIFASNQSGDFTCHTFPMFKPINTKHLQAADISELTLVAARDPNYSRLPWASGLALWNVRVILGSFAAAVVFGMVWSFVAGRRAVKAKRITEEAVSVEEMESEQSS